ncbi:MAG: phage tail protein [Oscillospiraceae bacterium]|nr:phage tail protein [Oscillospiraceae bacterium]
MKTFELYNIENYAVLDGGESGCTWHRLQLDYEAEDSMLLHVSFYASDDKGAAAQKRPDAFVKTCTLTLADSPQKFDMLLHDCTGRYLCVDTQIPLKSLTASSPAQSLLDYLPEIYQERGSFADRYLSVFQSLYEDMESSIENSGSLYDVESAEDAFLPELAHWLGLEDTLLWGAGRLREVLKHTGRLHRARGTIGGLELIIKLYCGGQAYFVENYHIKRYIKNNSELKHFYPDYGEHFTLWIFLSAELNEGEKETLEELINRNKPAHVSARLIVLKQAIVPGSHSYLGINSVISDYSQARLGGDSALNYAVLG